MASLRERILAWLYPRPQARAWALLAPGTIWLVLFFLVPILIMFVVQPHAPRHLRRASRPASPWSTTGASSIRSTSKSSSAPSSGRSPAPSSAWCSAIPWRTSSRAGGRWKNLLLFLVVLPFWTSFLVRTFAMIFLLRDTGLINNWLLKLGLIDEPITMLYTPFAVMAGLVYGFLPFMILPIYASLEKLDLSLLEAAEVLGAKPGRAVPPGHAAALDAGRGGRLPAGLHPRPRLLPDLRPAGRRQAAHDRQPGAEPVLRRPQLAVRLGGVVHRDGAGAGGGDGLPAGEGQGPGGAA